MIRSRFLAAAFFALLPTAHAVPPAAAPYTPIYDGVAPGELHEYGKGNHGFGFGLTPTLSPPGWFDVTLYAWLVRMGFAS